MDFVQGEHDWLKALQNDIRGAAKGDGSGNAKFALNAGKLGNVEAAKYGTMETAELTLLNGWTYADNAPSYTPKAYRVGNTVTINGVITGGNKEAWTQIFILPLGMHPQHSKFISTSSSGGHCAYFIGPSGEVSVVMLREGTIHINCTFGLK